MRYSQVVSGVARVIQARRVALSSLWGYSVTEAHFILG